MTLALPAAAGWDLAKANRLQEKLRPRARCRSQTVPYHGAEGLSMPDLPNTVNKTKLAFSHVKGWL